MPSAISLLSLHDSCPCCYLKVEVAAWVVRVEDRLPERWDLMDLEGGYSGEGRAYNCWIEKKDYAVAA